MSERMSPGGSKFRNSLSRRWDRGVRAMIRLLFRRFSGLPGKPGDGPNLLPWKKVDAAAAKTGQIAGDMKRHLFGMTLAPLPEARQQ